MADLKLSSVDAVQNPALGAVLLWSFGRGFQQEVMGRLPVLHLAFLVLPIVLHRPTLELVSGTFPSSGLGKFIEKFERHREDLMAVHTRTLAMRRLTLEGLSTGVASGLLSIDYATGVLRANDVKLRQPSERIKPYAAAAGKLGHWVARVPPANVFSLLRVSA